MDLKVYALPVSGGGFVTQLGLISVLCDALKIANPISTSARDYSPDIVMASSGGNVATYLAMAGGWSSSGIRVKATYLKSEMFVGSWIPGLPSWLALPSTGSIYRRGFGPEDLFECLFTSTSIQRTEVWTGVFDQNRLRASMFCNRRVEKCLIKPHHFDPFASIYSTRKLNYLNGNVRDIARVCYGSAAIPFVTQPQPFRGTTFTDGGTMFSSPLSVLDRSLRPIIVKGGRRLRMFYICSYNMEDYQPEVNRYTRSIGSVIHGGIVQDRGNSIGILDSLASDEEVIHRQTYRNLNSKKLADILIGLETEKHYVIMLFPVEEEKVNITSFDARDVIEGMESIAEDFRAHVWTLRADPTGESH